MKKKIVGTHNGSFHADDVVGFAILHELYGEVELIRSRDEKELEKCDIVFDVGGGKYDHHTNDKEYRENGIPYAASGLIWRDFGKELIQKSGVEREEDINQIHAYIDETFISGLDAVDNGVNVNADIHVHNFADTIDTFNPTWDNVEYEEEAFYAAATVASSVLKNLIHQQIANLKAKNNIIEAFNNRTDKRLLVLDSPLNWKHTLLEIDTNEEVLFVVYPDSHQGYRIQVVTLSPNTFDARKDLPEEWAGLRDEELGNTIGINDAIFCHPGRFIAGAYSYESIMRMARIALLEPGEIDIELIREYSLEEAESLFEWLVENKDKPAQVKIDKVRSVLGNGNSFTLFYQEDKDGSEGVELHVAIDDYEDEQNREQIHFSVDVRTYFEESFKDINEAYVYYNKRIKEEIAL